MTTPGTDKQETERRHALAWALTTVGGALFLLGFLRLITGFGIPTDTAPALLSLRLAGWFAVSGWLVEYFPCIDSLCRRVWTTIRIPFRAPTDGILEVLLGGLFFIVVLLAGMVGLWSRTVR